MGVLVEIVAQIFAEVVLGLVMELLVRVAVLLIASVAAVFEKRIRLLSVVTGLICGALSLLFFRAALISETRLQVVNLIVTPILAGWMMHALGAARERRGDDPLPVDRFLSGYLFTLGYLLVRLLAT
jgi:hypothetical protein